jgi:two-component system NtrC family sensor kinase
MRQYYKLIVLFIIFFSSCTNIPKKDVLDLSIRGSKLTSINNIKEAQSNLSDYNNPTIIKSSSDYFYLEITAVNNNLYDSVFCLTIPISYIDHVFISEDINSLPNNGYGDLDVRNAEAVNDPYPTWVTTISTNKSKKIYILIQDKGDLGVKFLSEVLVQNYNDRMIRNGFFGIFVGIMLAMILYNAFIFIQIRNKDYLYYVLFLFSLLVTQATLLGISYYFLEKETNIDDGLIYAGSSLLGIFGLKFVYDFTQVKKHFSKINFFFNYVYISYGLCLIFVFFNLKHISHIILNINGLLVPAILIGLMFIAGRRGVPNANYILLAWSSFFFGVFVFVGKDSGIIPYSPISNFLMPIGASIAAILLSFALANQINALKQEKEESDKRVIEEVKKNEELVINQNIILEKKVKERTAELEEALRNLKAAQSQLVQSEKMASLGVLTAGIAHEINNPINFVSANVIPLKENIEILTKLLGEYKRIDPSSPEKELERMLEMEKDFEIDYLLKETDLLIDGIEEGAKRTHTIVDGLKTFSRGDGSEESLGDINKGIESTLSVLKSKLKGLKVNLNLGTLPLVNCQIGKLNQVFLNLINNAIDALEEKNGANSGNSTIEISTSINAKNEVEIHISDNANGIPEEQKEKLFEPFFTTKAIGKGTGLGLAISYGITEEHNGTIEFESELGKGSTFTVVIPQK